jgi:hypothetical protein
MMWLSHDNLYIFRLHCTAVQCDNQNVPQIDYSRTREVANMRGSMIRGELYRTLQMILPVRPIVYPYGADFSYGTD